MPRFSDDIAICGRMDTNCVNAVAHSLQAGSNASFQCECLPGCFAVNYATEISLSPLFQSPWLKEKGMGKTNTAIVHIYYKENSFRSQRKEELIGFTEFLCMFLCVIFPLLEIKIDEFMILFQYQCSQYRRFTWLIYGLQCYIDL